MAKQTGETAGWHKRDYATEVMGKYALNITVFEQPEPRGVVIPLVPGLAAKRRLAEPLAIELAYNGHTPVLIGHEGASADGIRAIQYVFESLDNFEFAGNNIAVTESQPIIPIGYSLGARKATFAREAMADDTRIQGIVLEAAACLGGVRTLQAPFDVGRSISQELIYMKYHSLEHYQVALESYQYMKALGWRAIEELRDASTSSVEPSIIRLQQRGVQFTAVDHPDDILVSPSRNAKVYARLGIDRYVVEAPFAGHNAHLYHPKEAAAAVEQAITNVLKSY